MKKRTLRVIWDEFEAKVKKVDLLLDKIIKGQKKFLKS